MLHILISQLGYLAIWSMVLAGGVIFLRRGRTVRCPSCSALPSSC